MLPLKGMALDLGGIAKGNVLDRAAQVIRSNGISSALVNAGGDIVAIGEREPGRKWRVGVQDPRNRGSVVATLEVADRIVMTSGDYERSFQYEGKTYHHILNPSTGYPARDVSSVTICRFGGGWGKVRTFGTRGFCARPGARHEADQDVPRARGISHNLQGGIRDDRGRQEALPD